MSGKDEILRKAKEEMRLSETILSAIPGFKGYKEKELRRESDRLIRDHLRRRLKDAEDLLKKFFQKLSDERIYGVLENTDRLVMEFDRVKARIDHASYGYSGFFDIVKIDERDLEEMLAFDNGLIESVEKILNQSKTLKDIGIDKVEEIHKGLEALRSSLNELEEAFNGRKDKIWGVK